MSTRDYSRVDWGFKLNLKSHIVGFKIIRNFRAGLITVRGGDLAVASIISVRVMMLVVVVFPGTLPVLLERGLSDEPPQAHVEGHVLSAVAILDTELSRPRWPLAAGG